MLWLLIPLLIVTGESRAETRVSTQVGGENSNIETSITTSVNGQTSRVTSNQPGEIRVSNINGQVQVETSEGLTPTVSPPNITAEPILNNRPTNVIKQKIIAWFNSFWFRLSRWWR